MYARPLRSSLGRLILSALMLLGVGGHWGNRAHATESADALASRRPQLLILEDVPEIFQPKQPRGEAQQDQLEALSLFAAARIQIVGLDEQIARGDFAPLLEWLRANIHGQGRLKSAVQLMQDVTGAELSTEPFKAHLRARYLAD